MIKFNEIEELLPGYFSNDLSEADRETIDSWRIESDENEILFGEVLQAWESTSLLMEMERFNSFEALKKVHSRLRPTVYEMFSISLQRIAAILLLPLLGYSGYLTIQNQKNKQLNASVIMQTVSSRQGMVTQFALSDGTKVWLNSGSELIFPLHFEEHKREVNLKGEAFFEVKRDEKHPFLVNANELKVEVLGTSFNVVNFEDENQSEIVLVTGMVSLSAGSGEFAKDYGTIHTGQRAVFEKKNHQLVTEEVTVGKYIAWLDGNLIFRDDSMDVVVKKLSRWFNVEIIVNDPVIKSYVYKATLRNENLVQVLNLLKLSAPIDYRITDRKILPDGNFTKQKVYLMNKGS